MTVDIRAAAERTVRLDHLIGVYAVGSGDWSWQEEYAKLYERDYQRALTEQIRVNGITEPILLGNDGRVWDGHHRICAAMHIGIDSVPVEFSNTHVPRVTLTPEQIAAVLRRHYFDELLLGNIEWDGYTAVCACGWSSEEYKMPGDAHEAHSEHAAAHVLALMAGLAEGESSG